MPKVTDLLNSLGMAEDGISTVYPETFVGDITAAYDEDMSIPAAKIEVLMSENAALQAEVTALKAHNYELMVSVPATAPDVEPENESDAPESEDDDNDDNSGVDSLFTEKKEDN